MVLILSEYCLEKFSSTPRPATVRMLSIESIATFPACSRAALLRAILRVRTRLWTTVPMTSSGTMGIIKRVIIQEYTNAITRENTRAKSVSIKVLSWLPVAWGGGIYEIEYFDNYIFMHKLTP